MTEYFGFWTGGAPATLGGPGTYANGVDSYGANEFVCPGSGPQDVDELSFYSSGSSGASLRLAVLTPYNGGVNTLKAQGLAAFVPGGSGWLGHIGAANIEQVGPLTGGAAYMIALTGTANFYGYTTTGNPPGDMRYDSADRTGGFADNLSLANPSTTRRYMRCGVTAAVTVPVVTTQPASAIDEDSATLHGTIADTGADPTCDSRGFVYGATSHGDPGNVAPASAGYDSYTSESGSFGTGAFTGAASGLSAYPATYHVRAWAHNSAGYSYGNEISFQPAQALPDNSYTTDFPATENPISEGNVWLNGQLEGLDWKNVRTNGVMAYGVQTGGGYDDSTAVLKGAWADDQTCQATIKIVNIPTGAAEVELRLRSAISAHAITGYEVLISVVPTSGYGIQLVRWNGPLGKFTALADDAGAHHGADGDVLAASAVGTVIKVWLNGDLVLTHDTAGDSAPTDGSGGPARYSSGAPGIGFYCGGAVLTDYGFSHFEASGIRPPTLRTVQPALSWRN